MTEKRLFVVTIEQEVVVLAESIEEAEELANDERIDIDDPDIHANPMTYLPGDWDTKSIPFGYRDEEKPDRTIQEWIEMGAAPEYVIPKKGVG